MPKSTIAVSYNNCFFCLEEIAKLFSEMAVPVFPLASLCVMVMVVCVNLCPIVWPNTSLDSTVIFFYVISFEFIDFELSRFSDVVCNVGGFYSNV